MDGLTLLKRELMLQVNERLYRQNTITYEMYQQAKQRILQWT